LIMEYADRGTLQDLFSGEILLSLRTKVKLSLDVARGLKALHECGLIHGDLKMENVLVFTNAADTDESDDRYTAKIGDFGASIVEVDTSSRISYSIPWNAPEYLEYLDGAGLKKTDVYSFGLLVWTVFIDGKNPFKELNSVSSLLSKDSWITSLEKLKSADDGACLLKLAAESIMDIFDNALHVPTCEVLNATMQFKPTRNRKLRDCSLEARVRLALRLPTRDELLTIQWTYSAGRKDPKPIEYAIITMQPLSG
jgi:serine/threonine protein kinase